MKRTSTLQWVCLIVGFLVLGLAGSIGAQMLTLPSECHDVRANFTSWTPVCRAAIIARHRAERAERAR